MRGVERQHTAQLVLAEGGAVAHLLLAHAHRHRLRHALQRPTNVKHRSIGTAQTVNTDALNVRTYEPSSPRRTA